MCPSTGFASSPLPCPSKHPEGTNSCVQQESLKRNLFGNHQNKQRYTADFSSRQSQERTRVRGDISSPGSCINRGTWKLPSTVTARKDVTSPFFKKLASVLIGKVTRSFGSYFFVYTMQLSHRLLETHDKSDGLKAKIPCVSERAQVPLLSGYSCLQQIFGDNLI